MTEDLSSAFSIPPVDLRNACDSLALDFERSDELPAGKPYLGQQRAIDAIEFGIRIPRDGYNLFVLGPNGSHRHGLAEDLARELAVEKGRPSDWCYVNNFADSERPRTLRFPAGRGSEYRDDMQDLIDEMRVAIPAAFDDDDYRNQLRALEEVTQKEVQGQWQSLDEKAAKSGIAVLQTPTGVVLAPVRDGEVLSDQEFADLPKRERKKIQATIHELSEELQARIEEMPKLRKRHRERVKKLNQEVTTHAVGVLLSELRKKYEEVPGVGSYLDAVQQDIIDNAEDFMQSETPSLPFLSRDPSRLFSKYEINLVVSNEKDATAPIVYETNPSYPNIIGKIEHRAEMGALVTDFRMIRSGALHQANGGYLILDIHRLLTRPFVWEALKQALFAKCVRIESPGETYGFVSTTTLRPEPVPLDIKIVLIGERWLYYLLSMYDHEFNDLFSVAADLDDELERTDENVNDYALLIATRARDHKLLSFSKPAIQRVIEQRARHAEDGERLSMHMRSLDDLLIQADYWAQRRNADLVDIGDVVKAIRQRDQRLNRVQKKIVDAIKRDTLLIDTSGEKVGQVNGLSVVDLGEFSFGHPMRITATTRIGTGDVLDVEREVELGGAIHSKGMMILSSALSSRYAPDQPLSMHGSVVFEQSYGGVEGDSASVAELCALMSSLSGISIKQNLAVTGSINQHGRVQVVGGINEKIEGFFEICKTRGLDGSHGVIIPQENVKHLMLQEEVVEAVRQGQFSVYAVQNIDEAITIITGTEAGQRDEDGNFPPDSVNGKVEGQLITYALLRKKHAEKDDEEEDEQE
jgi:lon-related putative ATP-dependent protease